MKASGHGAESCVLKTKVGKGGIKRDHNREMFVQEKSFQESLSQIKSDLKVSRRCAD
jgi:hypothetical protein